MDLIRVQALSNISPIDHREYLPASDCSGCRDLLVGSRSGRDPENRAKFY